MKKNFSEKWPLSLNRWPQDNINYIFELLVENTLKSNRECAHRRKWTRSFSLNSKNPNLQHLVFETSPEVRKLLINSNHLNIE
jgi:hypothetical protein